MDRDKLEKETYDALRKCLESSRNETEEKGVLSCAIPLEMINAVLEMLVAPVITTILADYLIRKYTAKDTKETIRMKLENIKAEADKIIVKKMKKIGKGKDETKEIVQKTSAELTLRLEFESYEEMDKFINELEKWVKDREVS